MKIEHTRLWAVCSCLTASLIGILDMPYGYYMILRVIFTVSAGYFAVLLYEKQNGLFLLMIGVVILYNPIFPVHLGEKSYWVAVNLGAVVAMIVSVRVLKKLSN